MNFVIFALCVAFAAALPSPVRERRQVANCVNTFLNVPNPCTNNPTNRIYFPHPRDNTKYLQCDRFGRMFIVQCPTGEIYNQAVTSCITPPVATTPSSVMVANTQCTAQNLAAGNIYFAITGDVHRFIECDPNGNANILTCPSQLNWDEARLSCVYSFTQVTPNPNAGLGNGGLLTGINNPCKGQAVTATAGLFFSHPDPSKFIQCDLAGDAYVLSCPSGLVWNEYSKTCISPYLVATTSG